MLKGWLQIRRDRYITAKTGLTMGAVCSDYIPKLLIILHVRGPKPGVVGDIGRLFGQHALTHPESEYHHAIMDGLTPRVRMQRA